VSQTEQSNHGNDLEEASAQQHPILPPTATWYPLIELAVAEDIGFGDISSQLSIPEDAYGTAVIEARQELVVCGTQVAAEVFNAVDPSLEVAIHHEDGEVAFPGNAVLLIDGSVHSILAAERAALNFLMHLSGIATWTKRHVAELHGTKARLLDTRKTLPGWRALEKYATRVGGARNHRTGLFDGILLKDNHVAIAGGVGACVRNARATAPAHLRIEVEVENEAQAIEAIEAGADILLLDNMSPAAIRKIVERLGGRVRLEASGGITLANLRSYAETGVDQISLGSLTHSAPAADLALELQSDRAEESSEIDA